MSSRKNPRVHFVVPYSFNLAPGQRFRFEQYLEYLKTNGFILKFSPFLRDSDYHILYTKGNVFRKIIALAIGLAKRILLLPVLIAADYVFIFREVAPIGPPLFEWIIKHVLQKKVIYDFDDAIWLTDRTSESWLSSVLRWRKKVGQICRWSYKVSCGNDYLCEYARRFNNQVILNPTTIDTIKVHNVDRFAHELPTSQSENQIVIGWTGSHSTLKYLLAVEPVLQDLENKYAHLRFLVIANKKPDLKLSRIDFKPWSLSSEIQDLNSFTIGIMPLPDDEWTKGKCGFKALQYMALGIPTVASPVGVNVRIIQDGINGFLCQRREDWRNKLELLIENESLRKAIGSAGKKQVVDHYSVISNRENFLSLFLIPTRNFLPLLFLYSHL